MDRKPMRIALILLCAALVLGIAALALLVTNRISAAPAAQEPAAAVGTPAAVFTEAEQPAELTFTPPPWPPVPTAQQQQPDTNTKTDDPPAEREPESWADASAARVTELMAGMTMEQKIYQLFVVYPEAVTGVALTTRATENTKAALEARPVGGFVYPQANIRSVEEFTAMVQGQQNYAAELSGGVRLLTCVDEEGGRVTRLGHLFPNTPKAMYSYKNAGAETAYDNAVTISKNMRSMLLNTDFAPVADVWTNPANTVIGDRAYSDDYAQAAELVSMAVKGFREQNIICTLKHFPGHGDTSTDSHYSTSVVTRTLDELRQGEFLPFRAGITAGADMVMIGHLILTDPALDEGVPATFSKKIVTGLLREELGFNGVIITDALTMSGATNFSSGSEACIQALMAGCDILLGAADSPEELEAIVRVFLTRAESDEAFRARVDESAARILTMKYAHQMID